MARKTAAKAGLTIALLTTCSCSDLVGSPAAGDSAPLIAHQDAPQAPAIPPLETSAGDRKSFADTNRVLERLKGNETPFAAAIAKRCFGPSFKAITFDPPAVTPDGPPVVPVRYLLSETRAGRSDDRFDISFRTVEGDDQFRIVSAVPTDLPCPYRQWSWIPGLPATSTATPHALQDRLARIVAAADRFVVAQFTNGQLQVTADHGIAKADTLVDGNLRLHDFVPQAFEAVPSLQGITYSEFAKVRDPRGNTVTKKIGEFTISRARSRTIRWDAMTPRKLVNAVDKAWRAPGFHFDPGVE